MRTDQNIPKLSFPLNWRAEADTLRKWSLLVFRLESSVFCRPGRPSEVFNEERS
jgi:hypothetical protein